MVKKTAEEKSLHVQILKQMLILATSGFGLVAALAWNNLVQEFVKTYVTSWLPKQSGVISLLIYAVVVTTLAVIVTLQLSRLLYKVEHK